MRLRIRFSLAALLVGWSVLCACFAYVGNVLQAFQVERSTADWIIARQGEVGFRKRARDTTSEVRYIYSGAELTLRDYLAGTSLEFVYLPSSPSDVELNRVLELPELRTLIVNDNAANLRFSQFKRARKLESLLVLTARCTREDFSPLNELATLEQLGVEMIHAGDGAVGVLAQIPQLETLTVEKSTVTEQEFLALAKLPRLKVLAISNCHITQTSIDALANMASIESLEINGTAIVDHRTTPLQTGCLGCVPGFQDNAN